MKSADIEKLAKDMESIGYEILEIKPECFGMQGFKEKILTGAYTVIIAPIQADLLLKTAEEYRETKEKLVEMTARYNKLLQNNAKSHPALGAEVCQ